MNKNKYKYNKKIFEKLKENHKKYLEKFFFIKKNYLEFLNHLKKFLFSQKSLNFKNLILIHLKIFLEKEIK
jgi:hypothetical protein